MINWISVQDRLPDVSGDYLVCCDCMDDTGEMLGNHFMVLSYSAKHGKFNAYDNHDDAESAFNNVSYWSEINLPEEYDV